MSRKVWKDNSPSIISESNTIPNGSLLTSILVIRVGCRGNLSKRNLSRFYYHCVTLTLPILDFTFPKVFHVRVDDKKSFKKFFSRDFSLRMITYFQEEDLAKRIRTKGTKISSR